MAIPIEDDFEDVLRKAAVGQRLGHGALSIRSNLSMKEVRALLAGEFNEDHLRRVAPVLNLNPDRMVALAQGAWYPQVVPPKGLECINMPFPDAGYPGASVNAYLVWDPATGAAVAFDAGTRAAPILAVLEQKSLRLEALFLTHTHRDHVGGYAELAAVLPAGRVYAPANESYAEAEKIEPDSKISIGKFVIRTVETNGHSRGALSYLVDGLDQPIAFVGDSLFCLSQGGAQQGYELALTNNRTKLLHLPPETILCPGHGPITTVAGELAHNPFF